MFAIDTNLLVYAHNEASNFNELATAFIENVLNDRDEDGNFNVCIPSQVLMEFVNVISVCPNLSFPHAYPLKTCEYKFSGNPLLPSSRFRLKDCRNDKKLGIFGQTLITRQNIEKPLSFSEAIQVINPL